MITVLIIASLVLYAVRYAYSGADNALYYAKGMYWEDAPDIHDVESAQEWAAHGSHFLLLVAILILWGWSWVKLGGFALSMFGASLIGDYYFNRFITRATGSDTKHWYWPLLKVRVPKLFSGRRMYQLVTGYVLLVWGITLWAQ